MYLTDLYDVFHDDHGEDLSWYLALALEEGGPVLDVAAGTGRLTVPLAEAGLPVTALELDSRMLAELRRRARAAPKHVRDRIDSVQGDMGAFDLPKRFSTVQIPFRSFLHMLDRQRQLGCLRACRDHLVPGGRFAMNVFHPDDDFMADCRGPGERRWQWVDERPTDDGGWILLSEAVHFDHARQRFVSRHRFECFGADGRLAWVKLERNELAYLYPGDVRDLLQAAGFADIEIFGDFRRRPHRLVGQEIVAIARAPGHQHQLSSESH